jgi:hypothetical protein
MGRQRVRRTIVVSQITDSDRFEAGLSDIAITRWTGLLLPEGSRSWRSGPNSGPSRDNSGVDLGRLAWLATVIACLLTAAVLLVQGYVGYALVTFAVAASAAINLR